jgi:hypothetical protein
LDFVIIRVYDILGNEVASLANEEKPARNYSTQLAIDSNPIDKRGKFLQNAGGKFCGDEKE